MVWKGGNGVDCREWDWTEWRGTIHDWFRGPVLAQIYLQEDGCLMATRGWHGCIRNWWRKWEPTYKQQVGEKLPFTIIPKRHVCTMEDRIIHEQKSCRKARHYIPVMVWPPFPFSAVDSEVSPPILLVLNLTQLKSWGIRLWKRLSCM